MVGHQIDVFTQFHKGMDTDNKKYLFRTGVHYFHVEYLPRHNLQPELVHMTRPGFASNHKLHIFAHLNTQFFCTSKTSSILYAKTE